MSQARPLPWEIRKENYLQHTGRPRLTARQVRQCARMRHREDLIDAGALLHGGSGIRVRRPLARARGGAG